MHHLKFVHLVCKENVRQGSTIIDATTGNGHDTLFLADLIKNHEKSTLTGYDIQSHAIQRTQQRLEEQNLDTTRIQLKEACHTQIEKDFQFKSVNLILFNLGYLPNANKAVTTLPETTLRACKSSLNKLKVNGLLIITVYPGHPNGKLEDKLLRLWIKEISNKSYKIQILKQMQSIDSPYVIIVKTSNHLTIN